MASTTIDVSSAIDQSPFSRAQVRIVLLCALIAMLDGFDTQAIAFVAPVIAAKWNLAVSSFGPVFGAGLGGLMVGALIFGPAADKYGRRNITLLTTALFGIFTLMTAWADSFTSLLVLRFLTGLGLGGAMPNIIALTAEYSPQRSRATMVSLMFCGFPLGAVLGGLLAAKMIPVFGWESTFWLGGAMPLLLLPVLMAWLPESFRFLATKKGTDQSKVREILTPIVGAEMASRLNFDVPVPAIGMAKVSVARLFGEGRTASTLLLWSVFFMNLLLLYFLVNWLPSLLRQAGIPLEKAIVSTALLNLGGIVGALIFARLIDKVGPYKVLAPAYLAAGLATLAIGQSAGLGFVQLMCMVFATGFCVIGAQISINALAANTYPTEIRSTGIGWALGIGRAGSIIGPVVGGQLVATGLSTSALFGVAAIPAGIACTAVLFLVWARRSRSA